MSTSALGNRKKSDKKCEMKSKGTNTLVKVGCIEDPDYCMLGIVLRKTSACWWTMLKHCLNRKWEEPDSIRWGPE